ncbi:acyl-CoA dehydrogenase [Kitasatospora sp. NBC_00315]|uniref:acyl-CoA dehydrogenase family protein n=1 Tax=Kitasatospora sp. NBC_00315 TaxID=2975963 RepID=UPI0032517D6B
MPAGPSARALTAALFDDGPAPTHEHWRKIVSTEAFRHREGLSTAERAALSYERLRVLDEEIPCAEELARDPRTLAAMHEWTATVDGGLATVAGIHYNLFLGSLLDSADAGHGAPRTDLAQFAGLGRTGTFLCTERDHGNDAAALETTATLDPESGGFVLHTPHEGAQKFMPNTSPIGGPKSAVVAARLLAAGRDQGVFLFLTPLTDRHGPLPGVRITPLPERTGTPVDHCATSFQHVRLPRTALVEGRHGWFGPDGEFRSELGSARKRFLHAIGRVTTGKLCMSACALGAARAALAIAVRYAGRRHISGPVAGLRIPLAAHRSHHGRLLEGLATAYAMTFLHRSVVRRWVAHEPAERATVERLVAIAKGWISWRARSVAIECRERCGAQGLFPVNGLAAFPADMEGAITAEGDNLAVWCKAASEMIFGHEPAGPAPSVGPDPDDLVRLRGLLAAAERIWHARARQGLRAGPAGDPIGRWNNAVAAALEVVGAHACLQAADAFAEAVATIPDPATRGLLSALCRLFLLREISGSSGDLLADGHLSAEQVRALPAEIEEVTARLAPHLATLAEAFDLPEEHLADLPMLAGAR